MWWHHNRSDDWTEHTIAIVPTMSTMSMSHGLDEHPSCVQKHASNTMIQCESRLVIRSTWLERPMRCRFRSISRTFMQYTSLLRGKNDSFGLRMMRAWLLPRSMIGRNPVRHWGKQLHEAKKRRKMMMMMMEIGVKCNAVHGIQHYQFHAPYHGVGSSIFGQGDWQEKLIHRLRIWTI